jgi:hypothetical protein
LITTRFFRKDKALNIGGENGQVAQKISGFRRNHRNYWDYRDPTHVEPHQSTKGECAMKKIVTLAVAIIAITLSSGCATRSLRMGREIVGQTFGIAVAEVYVANNTNYYIELVEVGNPEPTMMTPGMRTTHAWWGPGSEFLLVATAYNEKRQVVGTTQRRYRGPFTSNTGDAWILNPQMFTQLHLETSPGYNLDRGGDDGGGRRRRSRR